MQSIIALGFFDGVHLGHGALLRRTASAAAARGLRPMALTFDRSPGKDGRLLTAVTDRVRLIRSLYGIAEVEVLPFTDDFMHIPWQDFLALLQDRFDAAHLVCGWDYRFGWRGAGDAGALQSWCADRCLGCDVIPPLVIDGVTVSATFLKGLIASGETEAAIRWYGHPHTLSGTVQPGRHLGHTLGFPTANLLPAPELVLPKDGVYAVQAAVTSAGEDGQAPSAPASEAQAGARCFFGVCNVGTRPTVGGHRRTVETWLSGFEGELYGRTLTVDFYRLLRPEQRFASLEELRAQVFRDREAALAYFAQTPLR